MTDARQPGPQLACHLLASRQLAVTSSFQLSHKVSTPPVSNNQLTAHYGKDEARLVAEFIQLKLRRLRPS